MARNLERNLDFNEGRAAKSWALDLVILVMVVVMSAFAALIHEQYPLWAYTILGIATAFLAVRLIDTMVALGYRLYEIWKEVKNRREG